MLQRVFIKQQKLQIMAHKYLESEQKDERNRGTVLAKSQTTRCQARTVTGSSLKMLEARNADYL